MSLSRQKRPFLGKAVTPVTLVAYWLVFSLIFAASADLWIGFFSIIIGYVVADLVLDWFIRVGPDGEMRSNFPRKGILETKPQVFSRYVGAVLIGSAAGTITADLCLSGLGGMVAALFPLVGRGSVYVVGAGGSLAELSILWGAILRYFEPDKKPRMKDPKRKLRKAMGRG